MQAFFLPVGAGQRFCIYHPAEGDSARGAVIFLHPFAEEMNKSRRMAALQARALAKAGFAVLQIDLLGCGDSSGDFGDASWLLWRQDVAQAYRWLRARSQAPLTFWGLRTGCLLAAQVAADLPESPNFIFWQPVVSGKQYWQRFMRLKMVAEFASGQSKGVIEQLRLQLASGQAVEIAGYSISPELADGLETAELHPGRMHQGRVAWLELASREDAGIAPGSQKYIEQWQAAGFRVDARMVHGPAFWQTTEIEDAPELLPATLAALESWQ